MSNNIDEDLEKLITECNYIIKVVLINENEGVGISVDFAGQKNVVYRVVIDEENNIYGITYKSSLCEYEELIPLTPSIIRLYIVLDIYRQCRQLNISYEVVRFYNVNGEKIAFVDMFKLPLREDESEDEKIIEESVNRYINNKENLVDIINLLEKNGLSQTFNLIRGLIL